MGVTRIINIVDDLLNKTSAKYNVNGFESARILLDVSAIEGVKQIGIYGASDGDASNTSPRPPIYHNGMQITSNAVIDSIGKHEIWIDLRNIRSIYIYISNTNLTSFEGTCSFATFKERLDVERITSGMADIQKGGWIQEIEITTQKQIDFSVKMLTAVNSTTAKYFRLQGSNDNGTTWKAIPYLETNTGVIKKDGWFDMTERSSIDCFANVENWERVRLYANLSGNDKLEVKYNLHAEYVNGRDIPINYGNGEFGYWVANAFFLSGYKYLKVELTGSVVANGTVYLSTKAQKDGVDYPLNTEILDSNFQRINSPYFAATSGAFYLYGNPKGGFAVNLGEYDKGVAPYLLVNAGSNTGAATRTMFIKYTGYMEKPQPTGLEIYSEREDYTILENPIRNLRDAYNGDMLEYTSNSLTFHQFGINGIVYSIPFDSTSVPSLQEGEVISFAYLQPFGNRAGSIGSEFAINRIIVFTNKNRVLHNFPNRLVGGVVKYNNTDLSKFDESAVVNPYKKWIPTDSKDKTSVVKKYFPILKDYNYNQFDKRVGGTTGFVDHFGNGGLTQGTAEGNLLMNFQAQSSGFGKLSFASIARDGKMTMFGNYNLSVGQEPFVMGTSDGGRTWRVVQYFACVDMYNSELRGGKIDIIPISSVTPYTSGMLKVCRKQFNYPTKENKEPSTPFVLDEAQQALIKRFYVDADGDTAIELATAVNLGGVTPVVYFTKQMENVGDWEYICNNDMDAAGINNNGVFFRLIRVSNTVYKMYADLGDAYQSDWLCRHVHAVNKASNGFLVSTGESFVSNDEVMSGGHLYMILQNLQDGGGAVSIDTINKNNVYRLTSTGSGLNRACGAYIFNDGQNDPSILFVSDEGKYPKYNWKIEGRTTGIPITPYGVYIGKLKDIDDVSKFSCIMEFNRTIVSLSEHMGHFACDGHVAELILSKDGKKWHVESLLQGSVNGVDNRGNFYFGDKIVLFN